MKAIYAGLAADVAEADIMSYLYLCKRKSWELPYYIPVNGMEDVQVYIDFGSVKPTGPFIVNILSLCPTAIYESVMPCHYMIGVAPDGNYYGVFQFAGDGPSQFALSFTFPMYSGGDRRYFTEGYQIEPCETVMKVEACFPDLRDSLGFDNNGIYFGFTTDPGDSFGNAELRYLHYAFVRKGKIFEDAPKATFSSNLRRNFKTILERIYQLQCELVPAWYKEYLLAIYLRGFIKISGTAYRVTDLSMEGIDDDDHTWKPGVKMKKETHHYYGCTDESCVECCSPCDVSATAVIPPCCSPTVTAATAIEITESPLTPSIVVVGPHEGFESCYTDIYISFDVNNPHYTYEVESTDVYGDAQALDSLLLGTNTVAGYTVTKQGDGVVGVTRLYAVVGHGVAPGSGFELHIVEKVDGNLTGNVWDFDLVIIDGLTAC